MASVVRKGEDRLLVDKEQGLYGVFDGHMGSKASDIACGYFPKAFKHHYNGARGESSSEQRIKAALSLALADTNRQLKGLDCGATACVAVVTQDMVVVGNIGDSRALIFGPRASGKMGLVRKLSEDHHPDAPMERQRIIAAGGSVEGKRMWTPEGASLAVSRALGDRRFKSYGLSAEPEFKVWKRSGKCCYLVLATDGLFDRMSEMDIAKHLDAQEHVQERAIAARMAMVAEDIDRNQTSSVIVPVPSGFQGPLPTPVLGGDDISIVVVKV